MSLVIKRGDGRRRPDDRAGSAESRQTVHLLPCKIRPRKLADDGKRTTFTAPVDRYFCPYVKTKDRGQVAAAAAPSSSSPDDEDDVTLWQASLRGKLLKGVEHDMPVGYVGVLCKREADPADASAPANIVADDSDDATVRQLMYWNWNRVPTKEDPLLAAFDWVRASEAIMS